MDCEIEFLPVGEKSKGGDAIVIRYGNVDSYELMVIDGGTLESGQALVSHIREQFGAKAVISHALLTHPDADHASGLREVLAELDVRSLWLHVPASSAAASRPYFANKNWTDQGLAIRLSEEYDLIADIVKVAEQKTIPMFQPFAGMNIGPFKVLSPSKKMYQMLLPQFDRSPEPDQSAIEAEGWWIGKEPNWAAKLLEKALAKAQKWITESWDRELLKDGGVTSASNESSVVLYGNFGPGRSILLNGDAGVWALTQAAYFAEQMALPLQNFMFVQIPHHGSRRNVGPTILNRLLGPIQTETDPRRFSAFASAPNDDDSHPRKMVLNAFTRRGARVCATQGGNKVFKGGFPFRPGYGPVDPLPFTPKVEDYD